MVLMTAFNNGDDDDNEEDDKYSKMEVRTKMTVATTKRVTEKVTVTKITNNNR